MALHFNQSSLCRYTQLLLLPLCVIGAVYFSQQSIQAKQGWNACLNNTNHSVPTKIDDQGDRCLTDPCPAFCEVFGNSVIAAFALIALCLGIAYYLCKNQKCMTETSHQEADDKKLLAQIKNTYQK